MILASQLDDYAITQAKIRANETERLDELRRLGFSLVEGKSILR